MSGNEADVHRMLEGLNPTILLMCLVHFSGRADLLDEFEPVIRPVAEAHESDPRAVSAIRDAVGHYVIAGAEPKLQYADDVLFRRMLEVCIGAPLGDDMFLLLRDYVRFPAEPRPAPANPPSDFNVLIVGAGMAGISAGVRLDEAGINYTILEARNEVGGTWDLQRYPGCAVDTGSRQYSLSFALNASWSRYYPLAAEYRAYIRNVAAEFGVYRHINFETKVTSFQWDASDQLWIVDALHGGVEVRYRANVVITALGYLNTPIKPTFPGQENFRGVITHSAEWDENLDLTDKRVVLLGTGCTGAQIVAEVAPVVSHLTVVQRQANWVTPPGRVGMTVPEEERWGLEHVPFYVHWSRLTEGQPLFDITKAVRVDREWAASHDTVSEVADRITQGLRRYIGEKFDDRPDLIPLVTPDWPFFAKRPVLDPGYYDALKRPNVRLVGGTIAGYDSDAVILSDNTVVPCDTVILATGLVIEFARHLDIRGRDGVQLSEVFGVEPRAFMGTNVPGFPNLFLTAGPNSFPRTAGVVGGHSVVVEQQAHYAVECIRRLIRDNLAAMEVTSAATDEYNERLRAELAMTVFENAGGAHGYYRGPTGRATVQMPFNFAESRAMLSGPDLRNYTVSVAPSAGSPSAMLDDSAIG